MGIAMGIGKAAIYMHIPHYFPDSVAVTAGMVGAIGGLGGFICRIIFGYLFGLWTSYWLFLRALALTCLVWMHLVIRRMMSKKAPHLVHHIGNSLGRSA